MVEILRSKDQNRATMVEIFLRHSGPILSFRFGVLVLNLIGYLPSSLTYGVSLTNFETIVNFFSQVSNLNVH